MRCGKLQIIHLENMRRIFHSINFTLNLYIVVMKDVYLFVYMLSTYSVLNKHISKSSEI